MYNDDFKEMKIESDIFEDARASFNDVLQKLFLALANSKSSEGSITLKVNVETIKKSIRNTDMTIESEYRDIICPFFNYKVSSQVAVKNEAAGTNNPEMELKYDHAKKEFILKQIANTEQKSIFDDDMN